MECDKEYFRHVLLYSFDLKKTKLINSP